MRPLAFVVAGVAALASPCLAQTRPAPPEPEMPEIEGFTDAKTQGSYALGQYVANYLKGNNVSAEGVDLEVMVASMRAALAGEETKMSEEDAMASVRAFLGLLRKEVAARKVAEGERFLAENAARDGVVSLENGLQYEILQEGSGPIAKPGDKATVHYIGTLIDGTEFDQSRSRGRPFPVTVGRGVIPGWSEILQVMPAGSRWKVYIPAELGYGDRGSPPKIQPGEVLVFDMEVLEVTAATPRRVEAVTPPVAIPPRPKPQPGTPETPPQR